MASAIKAKLRHCDECAIYRDKPSREPEKDEDIDLADLRPWDHIYMDFASIQETGKKRWLILADRYSGFVHAEDMGTTATTLMVWTRLMKLCTILGFPQIIRTDLGPEFRDRFSQFCKDHRVLHQHCSVDFHQSNGSAERAVKT